MVRSFVAGLRAARRIGAADRQRRAGNTEGAFRAYASALEVLAARDIQKEAPWCRSAASVALVGYCRAAQELDRKAELLATLVHWRPFVLGWRHTPITPDEEEQLRWMEQLFHHLTQELPPRVST
ncbi:hypothetical protein [Pyxidicoccus sp. MSG2]|uniref:hypothetical protein n=1 Tax=Pyxidicoccus sp. MSG2 TaxID=2996790 RepID=UPI0022710509|nr:hypothetical protein [Pyxidicoccus sp. MSG2]MCY1021480.1 hypothetical protein [Pyxidicoccus sp. MSG2]